MADRIGVRLFASIDFEYDFRQNSRMLHHVRSWLLAGIGATALAQAALLADDVSSSPPTMPATTAASSQPLPSARAVIDRYVDVTGGKEAYASLKARHLEADYEMADLGVKGKLVADIRSDGKAHLYINVPDVDVFTLGVTDGIVWRNDQTNGPRVLTGAEETAMLQTLQFAPEISLEPYQSAEVTEITEINGVSVYKMQLHLKAIDATETRYYDIKSGLLLRTDGFIPTNQGTIEVTTRFSEYEDVAPIRMAMKIRQSMSGLSPEQVNTKVEHNIEIPDEVFALPPEVVDLIQRRAATQPAK